MAQFEYQIVEQAGGRVSHLNDRLMQLVNEGWEPQMMAGTPPHVSLLMRRPVAAPAAATAAAPAQVAAPRPAAPAPGAGTQPPRPSQ